jgi:hypothetical protein
VTFCSSDILLKSHSVKVTFCSSHFCSSDILFKWRSFEVTFCSSDILLKSHSVKVTFYWSHILFKWHSIQVTFCSSDILFKWHFVQVTFCSSDILFKWHSVQVTFCSSHILLKWQSIAVTFCSSDILLKSHSVQLSFCSSDNLLTLLQPVAMKFPVNRIIYTSQCLPYLTLPYQSQGSCHCSVGVAAGLSTLRPGLDPRAVRVWFCGLSGTGRGFSVEWLKFVPSVSFHCCSTLMRPSIYPEHCVVLNSSWRP